MGPNKLLLLWIAMLTVIGTARAQTPRQLTGKVTTFEEKPLAGVSIAIKNGSYYSYGITHSDSSGNFTLPDVVTGDTIIFSGMQIGGDQEIAVRGNNFIHARFPIVRTEIQGAGVTAKGPKSVETAPISRKVYREDGSFPNVTQYRATPPGGWAMFNSFVKSNLVYPELARKRSIEGVVVAAFKITSKRKLEDLKIIRGLGFGCDEEVLRVLAIPTDWAPAVYRGISDQEFEYAVEFKLSGN